MSINRKPSYVPWTAIFPQKARSELIRPEAGPGNTTWRGEKPIACRLSVTAQSAVCATGGGVADRGAATMPMATAVSARKKRSLTAAHLLYLRGVDEHPVAHAVGRLPPIPCLTAGKSLPV